jgi:protein-S-isoprenylcysteine O-methyltransferase Ste14
MALTVRALAARAAYGLAFTVVFPVALVVWARALESQFALPTGQSAWWGGLLTALGAACWAAGLCAIVGKGGGLPMNAFPPPRFVSSGIYAVLPHPIYFGWVVACAGISVVTGSAAGLWIVTPLLALGCTALVIGYERPDLRRRFPEVAASYRPWLSLPPGDERPPSMHEWASIWFSVLVPWLIAYDGVKRLGLPVDAFDVRLAPEKTWPVWLWTVPIYASAYLVVPAAPLLAPTRADLRAFAVRGLVSTAVLTVIYLAVPIVVPFRPFDTSHPFGGLLALDQRLASPAVAAWPAFHVVWAAFAAEAIGARSRKWSFAAWAWAALLSASCVTTGMHALVDVVAAWLFVIPLRQPMTVWRWLLDCAESLGNSWQAWRIGPVRVISHGVYAGTAAATGLLGMGTLAGASVLPDLLVIALATLLGAGLWAQLVEGSPSLLRPFGYYGAIAGSAAGALTVAALGHPAALVLAATATMAPWIQAIGRLRCLVQGCCHGHVVDGRYGIRVRNAHSRVVALAKLEGQPIHATQLYSIAGNVVLGVLLLRLWSLHAPLWFVVGTYLMLSGFARFMEEAYRGEPQTIHWVGLPMYQVLAIACVLAGAFLTAFGGAPAPSPGPILDPGVWAAALATGATYWFALGVDFPESNRRFARLSG